MVINLETFFSFLLLLFYFFRCLCKTANFLAITWMGKCNKDKSKEKTMSGLNKTQ